MARVPYLESSDLAPHDRDLLARNINLHRALAHSPDAARSFLGLGRYIRFQSRLDPRLRELAILQVGYAAQSPYEFSHHVRIGREFGVTDEDIRAIQAENTGQLTDLSALARAVLRAAREMTVRADLSDETFAELRKGLDNQQLVDLLVTISFYCGVVRLLGALRIDVEDDYLQYLREFPLPEQDR